MELIDRAEVERKILVQPWYDNRDEDSALYALSQAVAVDAVPVVRCGECRHWERRKSYWVECGSCKRTSADMLQTDYCSHGEPRTPPAE